MPVKFLIIFIIYVTISNAQFYQPPGFYPPQPYSPYPGQYPLPLSYPPCASQYPGNPGQPAYPQIPVPYNPMPTPNLPPYPTYPPTPNYPTNPPISPQQPYNLQTYSPSYDVTKTTTATKHPQVYYIAQLPKTAAELVKENIIKTQEYECPFCNGFAEVPKSLKIAPPPSSAAVLPGILDTIPTITKPDVSKIDDLKELCKKPLADLLEKKLSGKLRFDEDVLDGFLTGLGFGKIRK